MSDDGSDRNLSQWADKEAFSSHSQMDVESESDGGRTLIASFSNDIWGTMRTQWHVTVDGGEVSRLETGQA